MKHNPKRRKSKDNPYKIIDMGFKYIINFKDSNNTNQKVNVTHKVFKCFNEFELKDLSQMNEFDRHIEHLALKEQVLHKKMQNKQKSIEQIIIDKENKMKLYSAIQLLSIKQRRRVIQFYFYNMSKKEIAKKDNCSIRAVQYSLDIALKNLKKFLKKTSKF